MSTSDFRADDLPIHKRDRRPNYDRFPTIAGGAPSECAIGWDAIARRLRSTGSRTVVLEVYPGVHRSDVETLVRALGCDVAVDVTDALLPQQAIDELVAPDVTDDPVFGFVSRLTVDRFFDPSKLEELRARVGSASGSVVVFGTGASLVTSDGVVAFLDVSRWENTLRIRRRTYTSFVSPDTDGYPGRIYKRAWFVDWRAADRLKRGLFDGMDFVVDVCDPAEPKMITATAMFRALEAAAASPFRLVPYFDPAPWGGQWMKTVCDLDPAAENYGWCFDCVPEENSLLLAFGSHRVEIPSMNLIWRHPRAVLGEAVHGRFGEEFPIRFDFLDTMEGSNLSLQVHPLTEYIHEQFGMHFTQDESYYLLDAEPEASVYLGVREGVDREGMLADLRRAERGSRRSMPSAT